MNIKSLYFFKELTSDLNMTKTANRLFISQQTLSNHILRLEEYYDVKLFDRSHKLTLTTAGLHLLDFANLVLAKEKELQDIFIDIKNQKKGLFRFGASPLRTELLLPNILPFFSVSYPDIEIDLTTDNSTSLQQKVLQGDLDLALIIYRHPTPLIDAQLVYRDQIFLCIPDHLIKQHYATQYQTLLRETQAGATVSKFAKLPFLLPSSENLLGEVAMHCFQEAAISPKTYMTYKYASLAATIATKQLAACFMTAQHIASIKSQLPASTHILPLLFKENFVYHELSLIKRQEKYMPQYIQYFITLLESHFNSLNTFL